MVGLARRSGFVALLIPFACAPPALILDPVYPTFNGKISSVYKDKSVDEVEALFVRPFTERTLLETSGSSSAMLFDYAYLAKWTGERAGAQEALKNMKARYVDEGISFRVVVWGKRLKEVDLSRWRFRLHLKDEAIHGSFIEPIRFEPLGSPEREEFLVDKEVVWHSTADVTYPIMLEPSLSQVVLQVERDGEVVERHTWKLAWEE